VLTLLYILFVVFGKKYMQTRKEVNIPVWFLFTYNMALVALSAYMFIELIIGLYQANYNLRCETIRLGSQEPGDIRIANALYVYFVSKAVEFMDTIFMILRKKFSQITFLHVFHHSTMLLIWWICTMWLPGGQSYFGATFNCFIHVWMYLYYALACLPSMKDKLWWKKYITKMQLIQFFSALTHTSLALYNGCDYPLWVSPSTHNLMFTCSFTLKIYKYLKISYFLKGQYLLTGYMLILIVLFSNFYIHAYLKRPKKSQKKKE
jgi:hypothetical protein